LSEVGRGQVDSLRRALHRERYDLVLSSDLSRAADTANAASAEVELDAAWREIDVGEWEGLTAAEVAQRFPEQIEALKARRTFAIGGGESWPEVFQRVDHALAALRRRMPPEARVIVFTHGGIIAAILAGLLGVRDRFPWPLGRMRNTGRTTLRFSASGIDLVSHNDDSHVPGPLRERYEQRGDQVVVRLTSLGDDLANTATTDLNYAIKSARKASAGGVVSVSATSRQIVELVQQVAPSSTNDFRFVAPPEGCTSELLISERHRQVLKYGVQVLQI
jgi:broad specificity phosphatase PhoE